MGSVQGDRKLNRPARNDKTVNANRPAFGKELSGSKGLKTALFAAELSDEEVESELNELDGSVVELLLSSDPRPPDDDCIFIATGWVLLTHRKPTSGAPFSGDEYWR